MVRGTVDKFIAVIGVIIFLILIALGRLVGNTGFIDDSVLFIFFTILLYVLYDRLNLNPLFYAFFIVSLIPHNLGIYGFYFQSPFSFIQWDHVTHFFPLMASSLVLYSYLRQYMDDKFFGFKTLFLIAIVLSATLGIGAFIEKFEFIGFLVNGFGEGAAAFGAGDACAGQFVTSVEQIDAFGGGWLNTMADLMWNFYGAMTGIIIMSVFEFRLKKIA